MKNYIFCPLIKEKCKKESCAWYVIRLNDCALNSIAQILDSQTDSQTYSLVDILENI